MVFAGYAVPAMSLGDMADSFVKNNDQPYGAAHPKREHLETARRIVVKVRYKEMSKKKECCK